MRTNRQVYDQDCAAWAQATAALIRAGQWDDLDREALAEEIESVATSQQQALESHLEVVLTHLLTWCYGPTHPDVRRVAYDTPVIIAEMAPQMARAGALS